MKLADFDKFCEGLAATTRVIQWGNAHVWKVGGKIFAISSRWGPDTKEAGPAGEIGRISFKCSDFSYQILIEQEGIIPAPYLARAKWVQIHHPDAMSDEDIKSYIAQAHQIIAAKLPRTQRVKLGLVQDE